MRPLVEAGDRATWRAWLRRNHRRCDEVWLVFFKKHTGRASVSYPESVEEAICWGWIDGLKKRIDDERYTHRFTPRRAGSRWSTTNIEIARRMIAEKRMTKAGLRAFERRELYEEGPASASPREPELPEDMERKMRRHRKAWKNFEALAPGYRRRYVSWLAAAKREDTRRRRLDEVIAALARNEKPGMK